MKFFSKYYYLKSGRLADVVRLISVLAIGEKWNFRKNEGLNGTLNGIPNSAKEWFIIAKEHPEFFKFNQSEDAVVLLLRFVSRIEVNGIDKYPSLTIDQTQKLIDQSIALHDKEINRLQKNSYRIPLITTLLTLLVSLCITYLTLKNNDETIKRLENKIDIILTDSKFNKTQNIFSVDSTKKIIMER